MVALIATGLVSANIAVAQSTDYDRTGLYGGIGAGKAKSSMDNYNFTNRVGAGAGIGLSNFNTDDKATAYKAFLGYQFNRNWAVEGGYFDLGKFSDTANYTPAGQVSQSTRFRGLNLDLVGNMPVTDRFMFLASVGTHYDRLKYESRNDLTGINQSYTDKQGLNYKYGIGAQYKLSPDFYVRAGAERYHFKDSIDSRNNVNMYSVNFVMPFGNKRVAPVYVKQELAQPMPETTVVETTTQTYVPAPQPQKIVLGAESLFAFDKYDLTEQGRNSLDKVVSDLQGSNVDMIAITGYADRLGSHDYNMKLSTKRAQAVKAYLLSKMSIDDSKVSAIGRDGENPVTKLDDCKGNKPTKALIACLQPDRRVEIEITATKM